MGGYSFMTVADYPILTLKYYYYNNLVNHIFLPADYVEEKRFENSKNQIFWGEQFQESTESYIFLGYRQSARVCKQRLELFGINLKSAKQDFEHVKKLNPNAFESGINFPLRKVSFVNLKDTIKEIIKEKTSDSKNDSSSLNSLKNALINHQLILENQYLLEGFYIVLDCLQDDDIVEYDLTDLYSRYLNKGFLEDIQYEKIIVLAEGKTDTEFISKGLKKFYPYLAPYYHFIDFAEYKPNSRVSQLVHLVIAFSAARVKHSMIFVFDNDAAGSAAIKSLEKKTIPNNIKVMQLPYLKSKTKYITLGPTGKKKMNINGLACGIELYFGDDILSEDGKPVPVIWKAYEPTIKHYQGEIDKKGEVQQKFRNKLESSTEGFDDFKLLLNAINTVFK